MRHAARVDSTQAAIVAALRQAGARVWIIGLPVDLLVGFRGQLLLMECKVQVGKKAPRPSSTTKLQDKFMAEWSDMPVSIVDSPEAALRHLKVLA